MAPNRVAPDARLTTYLTSVGGSLAGFLPWLAQTKEQVLDLRNDDFMLLADLVRVTGQRLRLVLEPEPLVVVSAKPTTTGAAPWLGI